MYNIHCALYLDEKLFSKEVKTSKAIAGQAQSNLVPPPQSSSPSYL